MEGKKTFGVVKGSSDARRLCYGYGLHLNFQKLTITGEVVVPQEEAVVNTEDITVVVPEPPAKENTKPKDTDSYGLGTIAVLCVAAYFMLFN